jgi:hypothetical protein
MYVIGSPEEVSVNMWLIFKNPLWQLYACNFASARLLLMRDIVLFSGKLRLKYEQICYLRSVLLESHTVIMTATASTAMQNNITILLILVSPKRMMGAAC